jgi:murein DD-endopeptidase MepM/ murein hydrolase activator NlpD
MIPHAIPTRRRGAQLAVFSVVVMFGVPASAAVGSIVTAGEVGVQAERVITSGAGILFPIDPVPVCEVFNNFGGYSKTFGSGGHEGVDIGATQGQAVYAVEDGFLYERYEGGNPGLGWGLWSVTDVKYRYYHLSGFAEGLAVGDEVSRGQLIGFVGDTGNATPGGYHLHFEARPGPHPEYGSVDPVDPVPLLDIPTICHVYPKP